MSKAADSTTKPLSEPSPVSLTTIALDLLNTAWRIAIPVLVFSVAGLMLDRTLHTAPWITLQGMVLGFVVAALLVKKQIKAVNAREAQK